jgi:hypothetical protein
VTGAREEREVERERSFIDNQREKVYLELALKYSISGVQGMI